MTRHLRTESLAEADVPQVYLSLYQTFSHHLAIFVRGQLDPPAIEKGVLEQVQSVDGSLPVYGAQRLEETVSASLSQRRFSLEMVVLFALTALVLACIGIYGVIPTWSPRARMRSGFDSRSARADPTLSAWCCARECASPWLALPSD